MRLVQALAEAGCALQLCISDERRPRAAARAGAAAGTGATRSPAAFLERPARRRRSTRPNDLAAPPASGSSAPGRGGDLPLLHVDGGAHRAGHDPHAHPPRRRRGAQGAAAARGRAARDAAHADPSARACSSSPRPAPSCCRPCPASTRARRRCRTPSTTWPARCSPRWASSRRSSRRGTGAGADRAGAADGRARRRRPAPRSRSRAHRGDVRRHRAALRPDEPADDGRPRPALARAAAAEAAACSPGAPVLDACCGTGDLTFALGRACPGVRGDGPRLHAGDARARAAAKARAAPRPCRASSFVQGDLLALPFADGSFAAVTVGWGVRNVADLPRAFAEMARVTRPGGRVVCLESTSRRRRPGGASTPSGWAAWCRCLGALVTGDPRPTAYLPAPCARSRDAERAGGHHGRRRPARRALPAVRLRRRGAARRRGAGVTPADGPVVSAPAAAQLALRARRSAAYSRGLDRSRSGSRRSPAVPRRARRGLPRHPQRRRQAPAPAAHAALRAPRRGRSTSRCCAPPPRSSCCTWRRSCTTTCSTAPSCGAGGRPWPHEYGDEMAVSAGNFLLARAFSELVGSRRRRGGRRCSAPPPWGLSEGEGLQADDAHASRSRVDEYVRRCRRKTADLFSAACRLGALLTGAGDETVGRPGPSSGDSSASPSRCSTTSST